MTAREAADAFVAELDRLDGRQERLTGRTLATTDLTLRSRVDEVKLRLESAVAGDGVVLSDVMVAGAHLLALAVAAWEACVVRVELGDEEVA